MPAALEPPQQDALSVIAGTDLDEVYDIFDRQTGALVDWDDGDWEAVMEIRDNRGHLLARLANFGTSDGDIELLDEGRLRIFLAGAVTATLPITREYINETDRRIATWRARGTHAFDLVVTETGATDISGLIQGDLTVNRAVSS